MQGIVRRVLWRRSTTAAFQRRLASAQAVAADCCIPRAEVSARVNDLLLNMQRVDDKSPVPSSDDSKGVPLAELGMDVLDQAEFLANIGAEFNVAISPVHSATLSCTRSVVDFIASHPQAK